MHRFNYKYKQKTRENVFKKNRSEITSKLNSAFITGKSDTRKQFDEVIQWTEWIQCSDKVMLLGNLIDRIHLVHVVLSNQKEKENII